MLFYTGANKSNAIQGNPSLSLGGWISSSQVPNDYLNNLFSDIDYTTIKNDLKPIRVLGFKNLTGGIIPSFSVYTITPVNTSAKFKIGIILNAIDASCNCPYFEQLVSELANPFYVVLADCEGSSNALNLTNIPVNQFVGIFIQRVLIPDNNSDYKGKQKTCVDFHNDFVAIQARGLNPDLSDPLDLVQDENNAIDENITNEDDIQIVFSYTTPAP